MLFGGWRARAVRRAPGRTADVAVAAALIVTLAAVSAVAAAGVRAAGEPRVEGARDIAGLPGYGARGSVAVRYDHGQPVTVRFTIANRGVLPLTVTAIEPFPTTLGLLVAERVTVGGRALPVRLGPRERAEVEVAARFDHCAYFTERAIDVYPGARVTWRAAGVERVTTAAYADELLVRSPAIVDCPGRVLDRSAKQRNRDATITGRG